MVPGIGPCVALSGGGSIRDCGIESAEMAAGCDSGGSCTYEACPLTGPDGSGGANEVCVAARCGANGDAEGAIEMGAAYALPWETRAGSCTK